MRTLIQLLPSLEPFMKYGIRGLIFILVCATYFLLDKIITERPESIVGLAAILIVFIISLVGAGFGEYWDHRRALIPRIGKIVGRIPEDSFLHGGDPKKLAGQWNVRWYDENSSGGLAGHASGDPHTEPPPESHYLVIDHAQIHSIAQDPTTKAPYYWALGRISEQNVVTLIYWSDYERDVRNLVGTIFLEVKERIDHPLRMEGSWTGYTRYDQPVQSGRVVWEKV